MVIVALHLRLCENHLKILKETCKCCNSRIVVAIYTISISGIFQIHYLVSVLFEEEACFILLTQKQTSPSFINVIIIYGGFLFTIHHQTIFCHGKIETEKERPLFFNTIFKRDPKAKELFIGV